MLTHPQLSGAFAIPTHMTVSERVQLYRLSALAERVLEIGSYLGASASCFGAAIASRGLGGKIFCVDTWHNETMPEGSRDTLDDFTRNTAQYHELIIPVRGLSTDVIQKVKAQADRVDLLFIDGDHSYTAVKADWDAYHDLLRPRSVVVFHDSGWAEGVQRVIWDCVMPYVDQFDSLPNMWWGRIK
jgi:predicted O-methyltransferase YrrM